MDAPITATRTGDTYTDHGDIQRVKRPHLLLADLLEVAAGTGMRANEILGLRRQDVDFLRREIHVEVQSDGAGDVDVGGAQVAGESLCYPRDGRGSRCLLGAVGLGSGGAGGANFP